MLPNITFHVAFGKLLFAAADIAVAFLVQHMVKRTCANSNMATSQTHRVVHIALVAWLFNPYTATISTRGNGDSLVVLMQLGVLKLLQPTRSTVHAARSSSSAAIAGSAPSLGRMAMAGAVYALLVHWRVFPVIYGPSLMLYLWSITNGVWPAAAINHTSICAPLARCAI